MKAGPKAAVDPSPLPFVRQGAAKFAALCANFIVTLTGTGARKPMKLSPWQVELVASVYDAAAHQDDASHFVRLAAG